MPDRVKPLGTVVAFFILGTVVALSIITPFIILLWKTALGI